MGDGTLKYLFRMVFADRLIFEKKRTNEALNKRKRENNIFQIDPWNKHIKQKLFQ